MVVTWTLRWNYDVVATTYPNLLGVFPENVNVWTDLFLPAVAFYGVWWVLYVLWILLDGVSRPERGYDTVFNNFSPVIMDNLGITSLRCAAFSYLQFHFVGVVLAYLGAMGCYMSYYFHTAIVVLQLLSAVLQGAKMYSYFMLDVYEERLRDRLNPLGSNNKDLV